MIWLRRLLRLVLHTAPTVFLVVTLGFLLMQLAPADVVDSIAAESGAPDAEAMASFRHVLGLDQGVLAQLVAYYQELLSGSLGTSLRYGKPVTALIASRLPSTLLLVLTAIAFAAAIGIAIGTVMAFSAGRLRERILTLVTLLFYSLPSFWIGLMLMILFSVILGWLPTGGAASLGMRLPTAREWEAIARGDEQRLYAFDGLLDPTKQVTLGWLPTGGPASLGKRLTGIDFFLDRAKYLVLPALSLGLYYIAIYARLTRASVLELRRQDYVRTAVAKGLSGGQVALRHVLRNALIPVTTMAGMHIGAILGGAVVVETVFAWPGMGRLTYEAILSRDYTLLLGILLVSALVVVLVNILVDLLHGVLDPRIGARP